MLEKFSNIEFKRPSFGSLVRQTNHRRSYNNENQNPDEQIYKENNKKFNPFHSESKVPNNSRNSMNPQTFARISTGSLNTTVIANKNAPVSNPLQKRGLRLSN